MLYMLIMVHFSENQSKMGHFRHCSEEQRTLIKMLVMGNHKEVEKMISNALKCQPKPERPGRIYKTTI